MNTKKLLSLLVAVAVAGVLFSSGSLTGKNLVKPKEYTANGVIQKVTEKNQSIFIKSDKKVIKFQASKELCDQYKDKLNSMVTVKYTREKNKTLLIKSMNLKPDKKM